MAEEKKEISAEEKAKAEAIEKLRKDRIGNLESLLVYSGARYLKSSENPFGTKGMQAGNFAFNEFLTGKKANEIRDGIYKQKIAEAQEYETISQPEYTTNYELERNALGMIQDAQAGLSLKDLSDVVKKVAPEIKIEVPQGIQKMNYMELAEKASKAGKDYKPTKDEEALQTYFGAMTKAYEEFAGYSLIGKAMSEGYNAVFKGISEKFAPKKEEPSEPKK